MRIRTHVFLLAFLCTALGLGIFFHKVVHLEVPLTPGQTSEVWTLEAKLGFRAQSRPIKAELILPSDSPGYAVLSENFISRGYGLDIDNNDDGRRAHWTIRRARGDQVLYYRLSVYRDPATLGLGEKPDYPDVPVLEEPYKSALDAIVVDARSRSVDTASFTAAVLQRLNSAAPNENMALFTQNFFAPQDKVRTAQTLLAGARIPSRMIKGIRLGQESEGRVLEPWLEVYNGEQWLYFDPDSGERFLPDDFFVWHRGDEAFFNVEGASREQVNVASRQNLVDSMEVVSRRAMAQESTLEKFSLFELPLSVQSVYSVLLLIPIGVLVMVFLRNFIGLKTFGTFAPVLIALAFRETSLLNGVLLFTFVVALGLAVRFYLERLHLLLVPRLASVMIVVVFLLLAISMLGHQLGFETGLSVALFPMVILTLVIERMSLVWDERGASQALVEGLGSLLVAIIAYLVMSIELIEYWVFVFPELLLVCLALTLLAGRYTGYRLLELHRFSSLFRAK